MKVQTEPTIFSFESASQIRMVSVDTRPYFVAQDVCKALGIQAVDVALRKLDTDEKGTYSIRTPGGFQSQSVISESGLYTLILRCRDAVTPGTIPYRFRKWVTSEVLPAIRQTGQYSQRQPEVLADLVGTSTASTMNIRDGRRGKNATASKAAQRIADECVPMIMKAVQNQYHYSNENVGPAEFLPALLSDKGKTQLHTLLRELAENGHDVSGAHRELEVVRYMLAQQQKLLLDIATHAAYIQQATKIQ
ncbi:anti-repressor protein [Rahnella sp. FC061912-K]|uniref:BRO-N domain-containing protein n=1 Tax=Rahnella rivi TaxID=2816249 RepID=UPI001C2669AA|nr:BRO family protein [Rahnella rivi]MBU9831275.1 anti-repressor protein [Rahnella rivi]